MLWHVIVGFIIDINFLHFHVAHGQRRASCHRQLLTTMLRMACTLFSLNFVLTEASIPTPATPVEVFMKGENISGFNPANDTRNRH